MRRRVWGIVPLIAAAACGGKIESSGTSNSDPRTSVPSSGSGGGESIPPTAMSGSSSGGTAEPNWSGSSSGSSSGTIPVTGSEDASAPARGRPTLQAAASCGLPADAASRWLAFDSTSAAYNRDIFLVRADGTTLTQLTTDPSTEKDPAFSNDGSQLAFASDRSGAMQIYVMDLGTRTVKPLTSLAAGADEPSWSRDDTQIAFHSGASVYVMARNGSNPRVVGTGLDDFNAYEYPAFSTDGTQLIFDRNNEIDSLHLDGTGFRYVVQNTTTTIETPAVSPDGVNIAFAVELGNEKIAYAPLAGLANAFTAPTVTPDSSPSARRPAWGPGGVIAFEYALSTSAFNGEISTAGIALSTGPGATPCEIIAGPGDSRNPSWAPASFQPNSPGQ